MGTGRVFVSDHSIAVRVTSAWRRRALAGRWRDRQCGVAFRLVDHIRNETDGCNRRCTHVRISAETYEYP